jgi:hypothetical protein
MIWAVSLSTINLRANSLINIIILIKLEDFQYLTIPVSMLLIKITQPLLKKIYYPYLNRFRGKPAITEFD